MNEQDKNRIAVSIADLEQAVSVSVVKAIGERLLNG